MSNPLLDLARLQELNRLVHQEKALVELLDVLNFNFNWLIQFCEKNDITVPDRERLYQSQERIKVLIDEITDESYHVDKSDEELPVP